LCTSVIERGEGHEAFLLEGLFAEHLHQSGCELGQSLLLEHFLQTLVVDTVAVQFA
jgi:hypothetical protein